MGLHTGDLGGRAVAGGGGHGLSGVQGKEGKVRFMSPTSKKLNSRWIKE